MQALKPGLNVEFVAVVRGDAHAPIEPFPWAFRVYGVDGLQVREITSEAIAEGEAGELEARASGCVFCFPTIVTGLPIVCSGSAFVVLRGRVRAERARRALGGTRGSQGALVPLGYPVIP